MNIFCLESWSQVNLICTTMKGRMHLKWTGFGGWLISNQWNVVDNGERRAWSTLRRQEDFENANAGALALEVDWFRALVHFKSQWLRGWQLAVSLAGPQWSRWTQTICCMGVSDRSRLSDWRDGGHFFGRMGRDSWPDCFYTLRHRCRASGHAPPLQVVCQYYSQGWKIAGTTTLYLGAKGVSTGTSYT